VELRTVVKLNERGNWEDDVLRTQAGKLEWLEVMRGVAAVWVLMHHGVFSVSHFIGPLGEVPLISNGYLGVDFFFVLSGFIITFSSHRLLESGKGAREYLWARLVRIYVPYLPVGVGMYVLYVLFPGVSEGDRPWPSVLTTLTLLPSNAPPALSVAWTLVHEMIFYTIFWLWFVSLKLFWAMMVLWVTVIVGVYINGTELNQFGAYFLSPSNLSFVLGVGICMFMRKVTVSRSMGVLCGLFGALMVGLQVNTISPDRTWVALGFGLLVVAAASSAASGLCAWRWLLTLGTGSYAVYLVHDPVLSIAVRGVRMIFPNVSPLPGLVVVSAIALLAGLVYSWAYEQNAVRVVRRWIGSPWLSAKPAVG
jgi:peptidoglycan/LPS O-acetylase OafA/YrhL